MDAARAPERVPLPAERTAHRPWWMRALPFLGRPPALTAHQWHLLGIVGTATLFASYGMSILGLALPQIQAGLQVAEAGVGGLTAIVRLGVIPAVVFTALADHLGRRRLLLAAIVGFTLMTFVTAFTQDAVQFTVAQFGARVFIAAEMMLGVVVIAEEFDADIRGWGIGMIGALATLGHGVAAIVFALVNRLPFGWRALYVVGVVPLLLVPWFRRSLAETRRFELHREAHDEAFGWDAALQPFRNVVGMYPGRMIALCAALFPVAFTIETALIFVSKSLQQVHGYSPASVASLMLTMGVCAPVGNVVAGALADRFGRKGVMIVGIAVNALSTALFYNVSGAWVPPAFGLMVLTLSMVLVLFAALGSELFPTSYRSTASGVRWMVAALGAAMGLWVEGVLYGVAGSHARAITWMLVVTPIAPVIVACFLPETANQELEDIAPEK
jgi:MFS family permease